MRKIFLLVIVALVTLFTANAYSQESMPISYSNSEALSEIDNVRVTPPDMALIMSQDAQDVKNGEMYKVGRLLAVNINMQNSGTTDILSDGTMVWRMKISSEGAKALKIMFSDFDMPKGATLFLYNENRSQVIKVTDADKRDYSNRYSSPMVQGEDAYLEYIQPANVAGVPSFSIDKVVYLYRGVGAFVGYYEQKRGTNFGGSESCEVNVNCTVGNPWQDQKKGVAEIYVVEGWSAGFCTGSLVNNTANDGTPYFLTADHCGGVDAAADMGEWEFYFNFEASGCTNPTSAPRYNTVSGCTLKARPSGAQSSGTDFLLLQLNTTEDNLETIGAYYNGWDRSTTGAASGAGIHHPAGDIKKISFYTEQLTARTYSNGNTQNGHWWTQWQNNNNDITGVTEGGSSGSPLFNGANKLIVGTLTGGSSDCSASGQNRSDLYGRFDLHWENGGTANANRLKPWLDPTNSGATTCPGRYPNSGAGGDGISADFRGTPTTVAVGGSVAFTDLSTGNPTSWSWTFAGGTPATSTSQNPTVVYNTAGTYSVTLVATNANGNDTETKAGYITVTDDGPVDPETLVANFTASSYNITMGDCINFTDRSSGSPISWSWTFPGAATTTSTVQNPGNICYNTPGTYNVTLYVQDANGNFDSKVCEGCIVVANDAEQPIVDFSANVTTVPVGGVVRFTNMSQNGPYNQWAWSFEGGIPSASTDSIPPVVAYPQVGVYSVELRGRKVNGVQDLEYKQGYIRVVPDADETPTANFAASQTVVHPGATVSFIDLSVGNPCYWNWEFQGGNPETSTLTNPEVVYAQEGVYTVKLTVRNNLGSDEEVKEGYIIVSATDPCTAAPVADFNATARLIAAGSSVQFENLSTNGPTSTTWTFEGGLPLNCNDASPVNPVVYNTPGIYRVTLQVMNDCGYDQLVKERYIYVFDGPVHSYCDTLTNISDGDVVNSKAVSGSWGYIGGQNGNKVKSYAEYFYDYSFSQVRGLIVPVTHAVYGANDSYVKFCVWDAVDGKPGELLGSKKVLIRNIVANQDNLITFDAPIPVHGPFFVGYKINYPDANNDNYSDDLFVVPVVTNRAYNGTNTLYCEKASQWISSTDLFFINTSLPIQPVSCLVDVEQFEMEDGVEVYPNPTNGLVNININDVIGNVSIEVYDMIGRLVATENTNASECTINLSDRTEGLYLLKIVNGTQTITKKVLLTK